MIVLCLRMIVVNPGLINNSDFYCKIWISIIVFQHVIYSAKMIFFLDRMRRLGVSLVMEFAQA